MRHEGEYNKVDLAVSFLIGGIIGAGVAILVAPRSGRETREKIKEIAEDVTDKGKKYYGHVKGKVKSTVEMGKGFLGENKSDLSRSIEDL